MGFFESSILIISKVIDNDIIRRKHEKKSVQVRKMKKMKQVFKNLPKLLEIRSTMSLNGGVDLASFFLMFFLNVSQLFSIISICLIVWLALSRE